MGCYGLGAQVSLLIFHHPAPASRGLAEALNSSRVLRQFDYEVLVGGNPVFDDDSHNGRWKSWSPVLQLLRRHIRVSDRNPLLWTAARIVRGY